MRSSMVHISFVVMGLYWLRRQHAVFEPDARISVADYAQRRTPPMIPAVFETMLTSRGSFASSSRALPPPM